jgi:polar amino acid transport system substrate-binding protein
MDFKEIEILGGRKPIRKKLVSQDKGQKPMIDAFLSAIKHGEQSPIPLRDLLASAVATFSTLDSLRSGQSIDLAVPFR